MYEPHDVTALVDGEELFESIYSDLVRARRCILLTVWELASDFVIHREEGRTVTLAEFCRTALADHSELHIYLLLWEPPRKSLYGLLVLGWVRCDPRGFCDFRHRERLHVVRQRHPAVLNPYASHHQKFVACDLDGDDAAAHCFGHNMTAECWDNPEHTLRPDDRKAPYHDTGVRMRGPGVALFAAEFVRRFIGAGGPPPVALPPSRAVGEAAVPAAPLIKREYETPNVIDDWYRSRIAAARRLIYIENQYFDHPPTVEALIRAYRRAASGAEPLRIVLVLPHPKAIAPRLMARSMLRSVRRMRHATGGGIRCYTLAIPPSRWIQVHTKLTIVDDEWTAGSCNIATQSFRVDSEANVAVASVASTRGLIERLWPAWIGRDLGEGATIEAWLDAFEDAADRNAGASSPTGLLRHFPSPARGSPLRSRS